MAAYDTEILRHRRPTHEVPLPVGTTEARVRLVSPRFQWGTNLFGLCGRRGADQALYADRAFGWVTAGTLPFYWGRYEPTEGQVDAEGVRAAARMAHASGVRLKGHPLCWHTVCAPWLLEYSDDRVLGLLLDRIRREVGGYRGLIDQWDVVNEAVILPRFDRYDNAITRLARRYGADELVMRCFRAARDANPDAVLLINDFDLSEEYAAQIRRLLDRGCPIDAIGLQTHQHEGFRGEAAVASYLRRFEVFGLPLHFTENTILSGQIAPKVDDLNDLKIDPWPSTPEGEARQAAEAELFYRQVYAHPLTEALVWWDLEDGNWLGAPGGLCRADLSPKPAYHRLKTLIHDDWGFPAQTVGAPGGKAVFAGPAGRYKVQAGGRTWEVEL